MASIINASTAGVGGVITTADNSGILNLQTAGTTAVTIDASQNVGIGTASPTQPLSIRKAGAAYLDVAGGNRTLGTTSFTLGQAGDGVVTFFQRENAAMYWATNSTERMRLDASGNLLVGSTSAAVSTGERVSITASSGNNGLGIALGNFNKPAIAIYNGYTQTATATALQFQDWLSTVRGSITVTTSGTAYVTTSDYRLKENIAPMAGALATVAQLKPVTYTWKGHGAEGQGFIAHELAEVVPDCVSGEKDAVDEDGNPVYQGIDTSFLVATLVAAIQELKAEIDLLKGAK